jgi:hypothetical protein
VGRNLSVATRESLAAARLIPDAADKELVRVAAALLDSHLHTPVDAYGLSQRAL